MFRREESISRLRIQRAIVMKGFACIYEMIMFRIVAHLLLRAIPFAVVVSLNQSVVGFGPIQAIGRMYVKRLTPHIHSDPLTLA